MAVIACPQCGGMVSSEAAACLYCGAKDLPRECRHCRAIVPAAAWAQHCCPATAAPAVPTREIFVCDRCGSEVAAAADVCPACGNSVAEVIDAAEEATMPGSPGAGRATPAPVTAGGLHCAHCRQPVLPAFVYCPHCGVGLVPAMASEGDRCPEGETLLLYAADHGPAYLCPNCDREIAVDTLMAMRQCPHCGTVHFAD
ncbi:MAG TPA: zinc ribbon domain-containing protein [bacterium]|nr:zinc ribbon domain-containing protein [bacterium]